MGRARANVPGRIHAAGNKLACEHSSYELNDLGAGLRRCRSAVMELCWPAEMRAFGNARAGGLLVAHARVPWLGMSGHKVTTEGFCH